MMMNIQNRHVHTKGFTFIEITIALLIIGGFLGFVMPRLYQALTGSQRKNTEVALNGLKIQIIQYHSDTYQYPKTLNDLLKKPSDANIRVWRGPYVDIDGLRDAWGNEFAYRPLGAGSGKKAFELYSWGPNGEGSPQEEWIDVWNS